MKSARTLALVALTVGLALAGCGTETRSSGSGSNSASASDLPRSSDTAPFPNSEPSYDTSTTQLYYVVDQLTRYGSPMSAVTIGGAAQKTYVQGADAKAAPYSRDQYVAANDAKVCLDSELDKLKSNSAVKPALILDVDETAISNFWFMLTQPNLSAHSMNPGQELGQDPVIKPTLDLFNHAKSRGVSIFFISHRPQSQQAITESNLKAAGYTGYSEVYLSPPNAPPHAGEFKTATRKQIQAQGYTLIANMGDQFSDLNTVDGKPDTTCATKLPNPYYFIAW